MKILTNYNLLDVHIDLRLVMKILREISFYLSSFFHNYCCKVFLF